MAKRLKDKNAPKRALSGFILFGNDMRANDENIKTLPVTQQAAAIAKLWKELDESKKSEYNKKSDALKVQYQKEMEEYEKTDDYKNFQKMVLDNKTGEKQKKKRGSTKMSGYRLFVKENKQAIENGINQDDAGKRYIAKCGIMWNSLNEEQKNAYNDRAAQINLEKAAACDNDLEI